MLLVVAYEYSACTRSASAPGAVSAAATPGLGAPSFETPVTVELMPGQRSPLGRFVGGPCQRCDVVRQAVRPGLACVIWLTASTACVRELTPSARSTAATWSLTVSTDNDSSRAISLLGMPLSSSASTSACRGVKPSDSKLRTFCAGSGAGNG